MLVMAHIDLYLYNPHQMSVSHPFPSIDASVNGDADAWCGQGLKDRLQWPLIECKSDVGKQRITWIFNRLSQYI